MKKIFIPLIALALTATAFTSCEDVPAPYSINYDESNNTKPGNGSGTAADVLNTQETAWTVAEAIQKIKAANGTVNGLAYVKGTISKIVNYNDKYKSITYNIVDAAGNTEEIQVFSGKGLDGADFTAISDLNVGDQVVVLGNLKSFTNQNTGVTIMEIDKTSRIVSLKKNTTPPAADLNTEATAWTTDEAVAKIKETNAKLTAQTYVKGVITEVWSKLNKDGSLSYSIKTEGGTETIQIYAGLNKAGAKFVAPTDLKTGQTVLVKGFLMPYLKKDKKTGVETTIYQMAQGSVIINLTGTGTVTPPDPGTTPNKPVGTETIIKGTDFGAADLTNFTFTAPDGTKLSFEKGEGMTDTKYFSKYHSVRMYAKNALTIVASKTIKQIIITIDTYQNTPYNGNDQAYAESGSDKVTITKVSLSEVQFNGLNNNTVKIVNDFTENKGGTLLRIKAIKIVYAN